MRILIDDALSSRGQRSGIGTFAFNLYSHLAEIADCDFSDHNIVHRIPRYFKKWSYIGTTNIPMLTRKYDIVHHIGHYSPWITGRTLHAMTVHDLAELKYPEYISPAWRHYNRHSIKVGVQRADGLITVSETIRKEVLEIFPSVHPDKVFCCPAGIRKAFFNAKPQSTDLTAFSIQPFSYFLFVGELTRRKNLKFLIQCFIEAKKKNLIDESTKLVLVGRQSLGYHELASLIRNNGSIRELGYLSDEQISALYQSCKCFIFPSLYEGFGIPLVEAMIHRAPIIISDIGASQELNQNHGNQMFVFHLGAEKELIQAMASFDKNWNNIRLRLSYGDLSRYSYDAIARKHLEIYKSIVKKS